MWQRGYREEICGRLDRPWDIVIVGGGITGAGLLAEASRVGLRALLVEARDFASGTSSRSSKLVHGGLRYLRQGQFRVMRESVVERERLLRDARGLVLPLGFFLTSFERDRMPTWMFGAGLAIYDLIARKWAHERLGAADMVAREPSLRGAPLKGGYHYFDARTDDARLALRVLREAVRRGGTALNYAPATDLLRTATGAVRGVVVTDAETGRTFEVVARAVINATGAWADGLREKLGEGKRLRAIRGSHLVIAQERLPVRDAVSFLHPRDGRGVFALPWEGVTLVGTTDVDHPADLDIEPSISSVEGEYLLEAARHAFPSCELEERDVRSTWAGVRGVIDTGQADPSKESREHAVWKENGLLTVTGGKLTTFRLIALEALHAVAKEVPEIGRRVEGASIFDDPTDLPADVMALDEPLRSRLVGRHGFEAADVVACGDREAIAGTPALISELRFAARAEGVVHLDDLLLRRVRVGLLLPEGGVPLLATIRRVAQPELGWDDAQWDREAARYAEIWGRCYGNRFSPG